MPLKQENRLLAIGTPLGGDVLAVRSVSVQEQLGRLFHIEAELSSEDAEVDFDKVVGNNVTIRLDIGQKEERYFNGFVSRLAQVANQGGYAHYRAAIVPWLWFLTRTADCRIFQAKSTPDIIEAVFKGHGFNDYKLSLSGAYAPREYCVQYRETDFNFVSRLMEAEGIYYFFTHEDGKHTLVLADSISAHSPYSGYEEIAFHELEKGAAGREVVTDWTMEKEAQPVACALNDFDFTKPKTSLLSNSTVTRQYGAAQFEIYDYPGEYADPSEGERLSGVRLDELQTQYETLHGQASARGIAAGSTFTLKNHPRDDQNRDYLITGVALHADAGEFASGKTEGEFFSCNFAAIAKTQQFRPSRLTPKPIVQGPQTAIVVGPSGEEIHTDEYGRVKLQFHWDRYGKADENSSCWVRVSQEWAGKKWGAMHIPRIGQEVIVEFLEGDPDRPIITGRVYNADAMPPYALPAEKTKSTLKSNSSKGGNGFNEIRFEDKKGSEQIFVHAEKDQEIRVKNDRKEHIGNDRHLVVKNDKKERVFGDRHERVAKNHYEQINQTRSLTVKGEDIVTVVGKKSVDVTGDVAEEFRSDHSEQVTKDYYLKAGNISIEAESNLTLYVGDSYISIEASGIKISTQGQIQVESDGPMSLQSSATAELKSPNTTVKGDGTAVIKGGVVQIN